MSISRHRNVDCDISVVHVGNVVILSAIVTMSTVDIVIADTLTTTEHIAVDAA